jgi:hypothetical protein
MLYETFIISGIFITYFYMMYEHKKKNEEYYIKLLTKYKEYYTK